MPIKLKNIFEKEYGKKRGDRIFYAWGNKRGIHYPRKEAHHTAKLILKGNSSYINRMYKHLKSEHPSTKHRLFKI